MGFKRGSRSLQNHRRRQDLAEDSVCQCGHRLFGRQHRSSRNQRGLRRHVAIPALSVDVQVRWTGQRSLSKLGWRQDLGENQGRAAGGRLGKSCRCSGAFTPQRGVCSDRGQEIRTISLGRLGPNLERGDHQLNHGHAPVLLRPADCRSQGLQPHLQARALSLREQRWRQELWPGGGGGSAFRSPRAVD